MARACGICTPRARDDQPRYTHRTLETLTGRAGPGEGVLFIHARPGGTYDRLAHSFPILFNPHTVVVSGDETTITTGGVEHPVLRVLHCPLDQTRDHWVRGVICTHFFLRLPFHGPASLCPLYQTVLWTT